MKYRLIVVIPDQSYDIVCDDFEIMDGQILIKQPRFVEEPDEVVAESVGFPLPNVRAYWLHRWNAGES